MKMHFFKKNEVNDKDNILANNSQLLTDNKAFKVKIDTEINKNKVLTTKISYCFKLLIISNIITVITVIMGIICFIYKPEIQEFIKLHISN